jgi:hypothetical protein
LKKLSFEPEDGGDKSPGTPADFYRSTRRSNPEDLNHNIGDLVSDSVKMPDLHFVYQWLDVTKHKKLLLNEPATVRPLLILVIPPAVTRKCPSS